METLQRLDHISELIGTLHHVLWIAGFGIAFAILYLLLKLYQLRFTWFFFAAQATAVTAWLQSKAIRKPDIMTEETVIPYARMMTTNQALWVLFFLFMIGGGIMALRILISEHEKQRDANKKVDPISKGSNTSL